MPPLGDETLGCGGQGDGSFRAVALGPIELPAIDPMDDLDVIVGDMHPLQSEDLTGAHAREQGQANNQLLADRKNLKDLLHLFRRQNASGWSRTGARSKKHLGGVGGE